MGNGDGVIGLGEGSDEEGGEAGFGWMGGVECNGDP